MELIAVAAVAENGVIGRDGELPWPSISADKRQYRNRIADWPVILGRPTFESMRDDLPGCAQIVMSRSVPDYDLKSVLIASSVDQAIETVESLGAERAYVIGGATVYEIFLPVVDRMVLSRVPGEYDGDAYFPEWDPEEWMLVNSTEYDGFTLEEWERNHG